MKVVFPNPDSPATLIEVLARFLNLVVTRKYHNSKGRSSLCDDFVSTRSSVLPRMYPQSPYLWFGSYSQG